jgi:hypothetical protein
LTFDSLSRELAYGTDPAIDYTLPGDDARLRER